MFSPLRSWPAISREPSDIARLFGQDSAQFQAELHKLLGYGDVPVLGLDLEWDEKTGRPTILGVSDGVLSVSVPYADGRPHLLNLLRAHPDVVLVGHNIVGADIAVLEQEGIKVKVEHAEDTIIRHWLVNMHLSKTTKKAVLEEDAEERKGRGFMNLGTMLSLYTDLSFYKDCRESSCEGPCPTHDVFGYNGTDALGPVLALPALKKTAMLRGIEHLYPMHRELAHYLARMQQEGIRIDVPYAGELREEWARDKEEQAKELPFNPRSQKQVIEFFREKYDIELEDTQEQTIRDAVEDEGGEDAAPPELVDLLQFKELGEGPDRWFAPRVWNGKTGHWVGFVDENGYAHPHLGFYTSSARMMCSGPNFQNIAKRRIDRRRCNCGHHRDEHAVSGCAIVGCGCTKFAGRNVGKRIRRAVIAPEGYYIVRADYSNAENRVYLYLAGYEAPKTDLHNWMVENIGIDNSHPFAVAMGSARDASKSVTHATDYGEGLKLMSPADLRRPKVRAEIAAGARLVFPDWTFRGKVVTFTGINLARRAFGEATYETRRNALEIAERYLGDGRAIPSDHGAWPIGPFGKVRDLQRRIFKQVEQEKVVRPPHGYALLSYGHDEDRLKTALAVWGSQPVAHISKLALIELWRRYERGESQERPVLQVHDEVLAYVPESVAPEQAMRELKSGMELETKEMPGFVVPTEASYGPNWRDQTKEKK